MTETAERNYNVALILSIIITASALIYLAAELRENTRALQASTSQEIIEAFHSQYQAVAQNEDLADILLRAARNPDEVMVHEKFRFYAHLFSMFRPYEIAYYQHKEGALDAKRWSGFNLQMVELISVKGIRGFWDARKHWFSEDFRYYIDTVLIPAAEKTDYRLPGS